jgi:hypothetical protein
MASSVGSGSCGARLELRFARVVPGVIPELVVEPDPPNSRDRPLAERHREVCVVFVGDLGGATAAAHKALSTALDRFFDPLLVFLPVDEVARDAHRAPDLRDGRAARRGLNGQIAEAGTLDALRIGPVGEGAVKRIAYVGNRRDGRDSRDGRDGRRRSPEIGRGGNEERRHQSFSAPSGGGSSCTSAKAVRPCTPGWVGVSAGKR